MPGERVDERLRQLLDLERRLEVLIRDAEAEAAARVAASRTDGERRRTAARAEEARLAGEEAEADRAGHEATLAACAESHRAAMAALAAFSDHDIDRLARRALALAINPDGGRP